MGTTDRVIGRIALPVIAAAGFLLIFSLIVASKNRNDENNAYIRVINCIVSYNASTRTQKEIESCYSTVERDTGTHLQRYDSSKK